MEVLNVFQQDVTTLGYARKRRKTLLEEEISLEFYDDYWSDLPWDLMFLIFQYATVQDIFSVAQVNKNLSRFFQNEVVWRTVLQSIFCEVSDETVKKFSSSWKEFAKIQLRSKVMLFTECGVTNSQDPQEGIRIETISWIILQGKMIKEIILAPEFSRCIDGVAISFTGEVYAFCGFRYRGEGMLHDFFPPNFLLNSRIVEVGESDFQTVNEKVLVSKLDLGKHKIIHGKFVSKPLENNLLLVLLTSCKKILLYNFSLYEGNILWELSFASRTELQNEFSNIFSDFNDDIVLETSGGYQLLLKLEPPKKVEEHVFVEECQCNEPKSGFRLVRLSKKNRVSKSNPVNLFDQSTAPLMLLGEEKVLECHLSDEAEWVMMLTETGNLFSLGKWASAIDAER